MPAQTLPRSAARYAREQRTEVGAAVAALKRLWRRMPADWDDGWLVLGPEMLKVLDIAQARVASGAVAFVPQVLEDTGQRVRDAQYAVQPSLLVGSAGDGRTTEGLLFGAVTRAKERVVEGLTPAAALLSGGKFLDLAARTVLADTGRTAERMSGHARHVTTYVRMLTPPSCGRCVQLAGKPSGRAAFQRHPGCDCKAIPASEAVAGDLTVEPQAYLAELDDAGDEEGLIRVLGSKANVQAWRDGADFNQIINAYRHGIHSAQTWSGRVTYTYEGTTRHGWANRAMNAAGLGGSRIIRLPGTHPGSRRAAYSANMRLMPQTIYSRAPNREQAIVMLRAYGWI